MSDELRHISLKLESIDKALNSMDKTMALQEVHLSEHIRRTAMLEEQMKPIRSHVLKMQGAGQFVFYASLMATILAAILMWK